MSKMSFALIGAGQRGMIYAQYAHDNADIEIAALVEPNKERREIAVEKLGVPADKVFTDVDEFFKLGKICDAVIIATMDKQHYDHAMKALDLHYDILLEKPISPNPRECLEIRNKADEVGSVVTVCHVLRYTGFWRKVKDIIDSGELGRVIDISHNENIGNFHISHSFVRGNWRRSDLTSPLIMQKSCHDMDLLVWLTGSNAKKISSFGNLTYFKKENAPAGSADRCASCKYKDTCRFSAYNIYLPIVGNWPATVLTTEQTEEGLKEAILTGDYGRCVYKCDNDVCDNQVTIIEFENGIHATFNLSGFTDAMCRTVKVMCENGEIRGDDVKNELEIIKFRSNMNQEQIIEKITPDVIEGFHGGGDTGLMIDFIDAIKNKGHENVSAISKSVESHVMAYAAELSRRESKVVDVDELKAELNPGK